MAMHKAGCVPLSRVFFIIIGIHSLAGCGGGGTLGLTGGSVPLGGRVVTGVAVLPDNTAVANAQVSVRSLPSGAIIRTSSTDSMGRFSVPGIPASGDISVVVSQPPKNTLEAIVPRSSLNANSDQPVDIGSVTALTTVVSAALHLEHGPAPEDAQSIVMNQQGQLTMQVHDARYSVDMQKQFIDDPSSAMAQALTLIVPTANSELTALAATPNSDTASAALNGLLGYVRAAHKRPIHLSDQTRAALTNAELAGKIYTPEAIAASLQSAGVQRVTGVDVSAASQHEHTELSALGSSGNGITAFEALVIASDVSTHGGFQLDQGSLNKFLASLLSQ